MTSIKLEDKSHNTSSRQFMVSDNREFPFLSSRTNDKGVCNMIRTHAIPHSLGHSTQGSYGIHIGSIATSKHKQACDHSMKY